MEKNSSSSEELAPLALKWRPRAHLDRESIAIYLGIEKAAPQSALRAIQLIDKAIEHARFFPDSGGRLRMEQLQNKEYRTVLAGSYIILYRYTADALTIYRILHQRQDIDTYAWWSFSEFRTHSKQAVIVL